MFVLAEVVDPTVGLTADRWDLIVLCLCVGLFVLGFMVARWL